MHLRLFPGLAECHAPSLVLACGNLLVPQLLPKPSHRHHVMPMHAALEGRPHLHNEASMLGQQGGHRGNASPPRHTPSLHFHMALSEPGDPAQVHPA